MATFAGSSEYEPLIVHENINDNTDVQVSKVIRPQRIKPLLFLIACLIITAIIIFAVNRTTKRNSTKWVRMEKSHSRKTHVPSLWSLKQQCEDDHLFTLTLALKLQNTDELDDLIAAVSDPANTETFHKYWTPEEVRSYFKPPNDAVQSVLDWLESNGFTEENGKVSKIGPYGNVIKVKVTCAEANDLLNTNYMFYHNVEDSSVHLRVQDGIYNIPSSVYEHIDFISPTIRFPLRHHTATIETMSDSAIASMNSRKDPEKKDDIDADGHIIYNDPERLYELYQMTSAASEIFRDEVDLDTNTCRQAVLSLIEEYYDDADLEQFWEIFNVFPRSQMERVPVTQPDGYGAEAELDTQYITSIGRGIYTYVFYMDDWEDPFLGLVEVIMNSDVKPLITSISYGADESSLGLEYATRSNQELGKLALMGITVLASSGDSGTLGEGDTCTDGIEYVPSFPASSPYVTAVGGTQDGHIAKGIHATTAETAWVDSGGGFSTMFDAPQWQYEAVSGYLDNKNVRLPNPERYVATGRAYPDISAQAVDFIINWQDELYVVSGTSCSSPTVAGMISLINYARIQSGKGSLGFLNPILYGLYNDQHGNYNDYFNDVVKGNNLGCAIDDNIGFYAARGWDPVTGVGTPKFQRWYEKFMDLD